MIFSMEEGGKHSSGMTGQDCRLLFPKGALIYNPNEVIGMTLNKHSVQMGYKDMGIIKGCEIIVEQVSWGENTDQANFE